MIYRSVIIFSIFLSGCTTISVAPAFPKLPVELAETCNQLKTAERASEISKFLETVVYNYKLYHECKAKVDLFLEWHNNQQQIRNNLATKK